MQTTLKKFAEMQEGNSGSFEFIFQIDANDFRFELALDLASSAETFTKFQKYHKLPEPILFSESPQTRFDLIFQSVIRPLVGAYASTKQFECLNATFLNNHL